MTRAFYMPKISPGELLTRLAVYSDENPDMAPCVEVLVHGEMFVGELQFFDDEHRVVALMDEKGRFSLVSGFSSIAVQNIHGLANQLGGCSTGKDTGQTLPGLPAMTVDIQTTVPDSDCRKAYLSHLLVNGIKEFFSESSGQLRENKQKKIEVISLNLEDSTKAVSLNVNDNTICINIGVDSDYYGLREKLAKRLQDSF